jgi:hypothetical protein
VWRRAAWAALYLALAYGWPVGRFVHAGEIARPFGIADIGMKKLAILSEEHAREVSFVSNAKVENVFELEKAKNINAPIAILSAVNFRARPAPRCG